MMDPKTIETPQGYRPTVEELTRDGHFRANCPQFNAVSVFAAQTLGGALSGKSVQIPHAVIVCTCGVIKVVPLSGG